MVSSNLKELFWFRVFHFQPPVDMIQHFKYTNESNFLAHIIHDLTLRFREWFQTYESLAMSAWGVCNAYYLLPGHKGGWVRQINCKQTWCQCKEKLERRQHICPQNIWIKIVYIPQWRCKRDTPQYGLRFCRGLKRRISTMLSSRDRALEMDSFLRN